MRYARIVKIGSPDRSRPLDRFGSLPQITIELAATWTDFDISRDPYTLSKPGLVASGPGESKK